jgi:ATP-dependent RNA helicase DDX19/DBP5
MEVKKSWAEEAEEEQKKLQEGIQNLKTVSDVEESSVKESPIPATTNKSNIGLRENGIKVIVEQDDPNSPLHSVKTFEQLNLKPELLQGIYGMGYNKPSKIQESTLPVILSEPPRNIIAQAQSGTGKTAAFALGMLSRSDPLIQQPQALCVCPTRELARQILDVVSQMGKFTKIQIQLVVKDIIFPKLISAQIVIGTPGKILDLIKTRTLNTNNIKIFVLDEADQMIDKQGLGDQSIKLKKCLPPKCQILLFSATFKDQVRLFAGNIVPRPCFNISLKVSELTVDGIKQLYIDCKNEPNKFKILSEIYAYLTVGQSIIFVQTRRTAQELSDKMKASGHTVSLLHGGDEIERDRVIDDFRDGKTKVLITTNVLARGIDILTVMMVINFDIPLDADNKPDPQTYIHRIGRSGRFGRKGVAINFIHDDISKRNLKYIENYLQKPIQEFPSNKLEDIQTILEQLQEEIKKEES